MSLFPVATAPIAESTERTHTCTSQPGVAP